MNRRKIIRELSRLSYEDDCSLCHGNIPHDSKTYGGVTSTGEVALVGECCRSKLKSLWCVGVYFAYPPGASRTMN
jgi:hypothetical protein